MKIKLKQIGEYQSYIDLKKSGEYYHMAIFSKLSDKDAFEIKHESFLTESEFANMIDGFVKVQNEIS